MGIRRRRVGDVLDARLAPVQVLHHEPGDVFRQRSGIPVSAPLGSPAPRTRSKSSSAHSAAERTRLCQSYGCGRFVEAGRAEGQHRVVGGRAAGASCGGCRAGKSAASRRPARRAPFLASTSGRWPTSGRMFSRRAPSGGSTPAAPPESREQGLEAAVQAVVGVPASEAGSWQLAKWHQGLPASIRASPPSSPVHERFRFSILFSGPVCPLLRPAVVFAR